MSTEINTRDFRPHDAAILYALYCDAIRITAADAYSEPEREAWIARAGGPEAFTQRLSESWVRVAEDAEGICGFASIQEPGHLDLLFTAPRANRRGVASLLLQDILFLAGAMAAQRITTDASRISRPFFAKHGFAETGQANRCCGTVTIECTQMQTAVPKFQ